jgi:signal transduction histidine kinase
MTILPFELAFPISAAIAVFGLGIIVWWSGKWSPGNLLFALLAFSLAFWTSVGWFRSLEAAALPTQILVWRLLFYVSIAFAPALALHLGFILARRAVGWMGGAAYFVSAILFLFLDTGFVVQDEKLLDLGALMSLLFLSFIVLCIAAMLYPTFRDESLSRFERRRASYGLLVLVIYLAAAMMQLLVTPVPSVILMTAFAAAFFAVSSAALVRVQFLDVHFAALEMLFILLATGSLITVLRARTFAEGAIALLSAVFIGLFGWRAIHLVHEASRRRLELERINAELERLDRARRDVVAAVAHQLRAPLGGIRFAADMFTRGDFGKLSDEGMKVMDHIRASTDRLLALAETSLNAARIEAGILQPEMSEVDVAMELRSLVADLSLPARAKGILMESHVQGLPPRLRLDREAFQNAVFNVLDNAVKYTDTGRVTLDATYRNNMLYIDVTDTGAGLSREDLTMLFQKFARGEEGKRRSTDGSGLGLYVARTLIEEMGGTITATSPGPGQGSTFSIELPARI